MEPKNFFSSIFQSNDAAINFLLENEHITNSRICPKCGKIMNINKCDRRINGKAYICSGRNCKKIISISLLLLETIKVEIKLLLRVVYAFVMNYDNAQAIANCEISEPTYIKIKTIIVNCISEFNKTAPKIGGENIEVQLDETAICNGKIIVCPSSSLDDVEGVQWILGGVEKTENKRLFMTLIPNRKKEVLLELFNNHIKRDSILITDGYPSYPWAVREFGSQHIVVNHSIGFKNAQGFTTNSIENIWSHFKNSYRSKHGLNHNRISSFIDEFLFRKRFLQYKTIEVYRNTFKLILSLLSKK